MRSSRFVRRIAGCCPLLMTGAASLLLATTGCANSLARGTGGEGNPALSDAALFRVVVLAELEERRRSGLLDPLSVDTLPWTDTDDQGRPTKAGLRRIPRGVARHRRAVLDSLGIPYANPSIRWRCEGAPATTGAERRVCPNSPQSQFQVSLAEPPERFWPFAIRRFFGRPGVDTIPPGTVSVSTSLFVLGPGGRTETGKSYLVRRSVEGWVIERSVHTIVSESFGRKP